jgi:hypothetical protein
MILVATAILLDPHATLSDHLLHAVLLLLHKEVSDHGRHLPHYFSLFHMYASLGVPEKTQLLKVSFRNAGCLEKILECFISLSTCILNSLMQYF